MRHRFTERRRGWRGTGVAPGLPRPALAMGQQRLCCLSLKFPTPPQQPAVTPTVAVDMFTHIKPM